MRRLSTQIVGKAGMSVPPAQDKQAFQLSSNREARVASFMHKSVVVDKNNLSNTIDGEVMHNSKSATAQKGHESAVELNESIQVQSDPRESMVLTKSRPKSGRKGHKKIKKIKKNDSQSR